jgi:alpha-ketoglutarate-dependent taurine dioxygenase
MSISGPEEHSSIMTGNELNADLVRAEQLAAEMTLPLVIRPARGNISLSDLLGWVKESRGFIEAKLLTHGALLFRDFPIDGYKDFRSFTTAAYGELEEYRERTSPRRQVSDRIYTSTDYPANQKIFPHNEHSYSLTYPLKLFFFCQTPAKQGGETPLADTRKVVMHIRQEIRDRFMQKKWMYVRNFSDYLGLSWQTVFRTSDKAVVEEYARQHKIEIEWKDGDRLRTRQIRPAFAKHPRSGELIWFNHITFFHISTLESSMREVLMEDAGEEWLPNNTYYGDGSPIEPEVLDELRAAYLKELVSFSWQKGDLVILDNMLTAHSRSSFVGPRKILFAMAQPYTRTDI